IGTSAAGPCAQLVMGHPPRCPGAQEPRRIEFMAATLEEQPLDPHSAHFIHQAAASKFDFQSISSKAAGDERLKASINNAVLRQYAGRQLRLLELPDADALRTLAGKIKQHALDHL